MKYITTIHKFNFNNTDKKNNMEKQIKRLGIYHSKDTDGHFSGAVLKYKYPDIDLLGWDYKDELPNLDEIVANYEEVILIDVTFPLNVLINLGIDVKVVVIDHHVSFFKTVFDEVNTMVNGELDNFKYDPESTEVWKVIRANLPFEYIYDGKLSACELGYRYYFGFVPPVLQRVGEYDTWRGNGTEDWEKTILPVKYSLYGKVSSPLDVIPEWFTTNPNASEKMIYDLVYEGKSVMKYERKMDESKTNSYAFEKKVYGGLTALCMNTNFFSSETMISKFDKDKHDLMIGFAYNGRNWGVSLRSVENGDSTIDVSEIAKARGGGGHESSSGFQVENFEDIFK